MSMSRPTRVRLVCLAVLLIALPAGAQHLRIYYPDIEQGSSTLVVSPTGKAMLIDAGTGLKTTDDGIEHFINDLIDAGIVASLDYTLATHYDEDHIGRMENVFQLVPMPPTAIAYDRGESGGAPQTFAYSDYAHGASQFNRTAATACQVIDLGGGVTVRVVTVNGDVCGASPVDISASGQFENSASVTVVVEYGDVDVWIGGDLTGNVDKGVSNVEEPAAPDTSDVDVYTMNHHGSESSSIAPFLDTLKAEVGINQNSASNTFGHPRAVVVSRFLGTLATSGGSPIFIQQNPGDPADPLSDDTLADAIADCDDVDGAFGLPGTLTLLSDGTSYRLHACGISPSVFAADEGLGTIGDYPPAILRVLRTPQVPLAAEAVAVEADVEDLEGAATVHLEWELDGVVQAPIPMSLQAGVTHTATIPAQADGARVSFRVAATDGASQTEVSPAEGYFSGTTRIATLRLNDASGVLVFTTYGVRVRGNMTVEPGVFHTFVTQAYVQDLTGGVQVLDSSIDGAIGRGDEVEWVGALEQSGGQTEVSMAGGFGNTGHVRIGPGSVPAPQVVTVAATGEAVEGKLIRIDNVTLVSGTIPETGSGNVTISDDGGATTMTLRIDGETDIPGANTPTQAFDVVGIAGQFDTWAPFNSAYLFHVASNHAFHDGNKRTAALAALVFLEVNGTESLPPPDELEKTDRPKEGSRGDIVSPARYKEAIMFSSQAITRGIRIQVEPEYDPSRSRPGANQWFFLYTVTIQNQGSETVQLMTRHWFITDERGHVEEVEGPGVVGEQPVLAPGESFRYTSGCPLTTATGTMHGSYRMVTTDGEAFDAEIAPFILSEPYTVH